MWVNLCSMRQSQRQSRQCYKAQQWSSSAGAGAGKHLPSRREIISEEQRSASFHLPSEGNTEPGK